MTIKLTKTYESGTTYSVNTNERHETEIKAKIDTEDAAAGLVGTWTYEILRVY